MSHNLNFNSEKGTFSFASAVESAWHQLGTVVDKAMTTQEAIKLANLDFEVIKEPQYTRLTLEPELLDDKGRVIKEGKYKFIETPETFSTVRKDTHQILGTVGDKYTVLQNNEAFTFFDPILEEGEAFIQTAGVIGNGERIFLSAKLPDYITVLGNADLIEQNILITTSHDAKSGTTVMFTPIRVVCQNTLNAALSSKTPNRITIKHTQNQLTRIHEAHKILGLNNQYTEEIEELFSKMADKKIDEGTYEKIIVQGLADNQNMVKNYFDDDAKQSTRFRNNVASVLEYAYTHPTQKTAATENTLFGAYNAITGWYQNVIEWDDNTSKMRSIIDTNGRVNIKQQQTFDACLSILN